jgi:hypothetical protein
MKNQHGLKEETNLYRKKIISHLRACDVTRVVSLDTKNQMKVFEEIGELGDICNLLLLLLVDLLIKLFLFYYVHSLSRFILQMVLRSGYLFFSICSTFNPDCSFVYE